MDSKTELPRHNRLPLRTTYPSNPELRLLFDIETNGLLPGVSKVHCIWAVDVDTGKFYDYGPDDIDQGLVLLSEAAELIGHNILGYDLPVLAKLYPEFAINKACVYSDTLVMAKLINQTQKDDDFKRYNREKGAREQLGKDAPGLLLGKHIGRHGLAAYGNRYNTPKGDYSDMMKAQGLDPWAEWSEEMHAYCKQDLIVNETLYNDLTTKKCSRAAIDLEQNFSVFLENMNAHGFPFDQKAAVSLVSELTVAIQECNAELADTFPAFYMRTGPVVCPKKTLNYKDKQRADRTIDAAFTPVELQQFNPGSSIHIVNRFKRKYGFEPTVFTDAGNPQMDKEVLDELTFPEAQTIARYFMLQKRIGQLADGPTAWLRKAVVHGKTHSMHGRVDGLGTRTRRCTHSSPNMGQVPSKVNANGKVPYGAECRALFYAPVGWTLVGVDASGLELRCLAHYLSYFDGGAYAKVAEQGDVHTTNMIAMGMPVTKENRALAKRLVYAILYGAGGLLLGKIVGKGPAAGNKLKKLWINNVPGLGALIKALEGVAKSRGGWIETIDGSWLMDPSSHTNVNTLLQSAGSVVCKLAPLICIEDATAQGLKFGKDYRIVAHVHDEFQTLVRDEHVAQYSSIAIESIRKAGEQLNMRVRLAGEANTGNNWANTH